MRALVGLTASLLLLGMSMPVALSDDEPTFQQLLEETLPGIGAERIEDRKNDQQRLQEACLRLGAPGREAERGEACRLIAARLGIDTAKPARIWLLKQLEFIGRGECVAAVAALLSDSDQQVRDAARRALANNPAAAANATLLAKLAEGGAPSWRVALINSLGFRADRSSVGPLARVLADEDETVAAAAANALGKIGGEQAARALDTAGGPRPLRVHVIDALLRCADKLLEEGRSDGALAIYKTL
ncbi:MAG: HEAT repeat domain-containing protein, partial [Armatimonadota bacterium]